MESIVGGAGPTVMRYLGHQILAVEGSAGRLGYIEAAGTRFVALAGERYDRAVEVGQALSADAAIALLLPAVEEVATSAAVSRREIARWLVEHVHRLGRCARSDAAVAAVEHFGAAAVLDRDVLRHFRRLHEGSIRYVGAGSYWLSLRATDPSSSADELGEIVA